MHPVRRLLAGDFDPGGDANNEEPGDIITKIAGPSPVSAKEKSRPQASHL